MPEIRERVYKARRWVFTKANLPFWIPGALLILIILACYFGPWLFDLPTGSISSLAQANLPIGTPGHLLGTDQLGNDTLSRALYGGRVSFEVSFGAIGLGALVGSNVGLTAGYLGGKVEIVIMRFLDMMLAFPGLIIALALAAVLGPSIRDEILAISFFTVPTYARLSRAQTLRVRERDFVVSSRIIGAKRRYVALRHVYPNIIPTLMTFMPLGLGISMLVEATLSYLGVGVRPPAPSWGNMIAAAQEIILSDPSQVLVPITFLIVTVFCLNLFGEQVRLRYSK
jgi:peptide/nickel transport system permease protein